MVIISGHGEDANANCAEFCPTSHHFSFNGAQEHVMEFTAGGEGSEGDMIGGLRRRGRGDRGKGKRIRGARSAWHGRGMGMWMTGKERHA